MAKNLYPTSHQIEDMFNWRESSETNDKFDALLDENLDAKLMGHDHHLAGEYKGKAAWKEGTRARFHGMVDPSKRKLEIINVIGGGETPWACVEMRTTGKATSGKKWNHESVYVIRFNMDGKISKMRVYTDTAHTNEHVEAHKKINST